jgi:hypothetical protein
MMRPSRSVCEPRAVIDNRIVSGRPVGTSRTCGWPLQYQLMSKYCTAMKQYHDVQDTWDSIQTIIEYWGRGSMDW